MVLETSKNKSVDYEYNELNQLVKKTTSQNEVYTYSYDKRGNRTAETGKKASQSFVYDATNRMVEGTNWKGDKSAYTYNGLGLRVNNLVTTHAGKTYDRDYVIDYTSPENDDLYVYAMGNGQLEYEQRHVYAGSERLEQITEKGKGGWERTLYVHEDVMGNTRYYTKATGQNFAELQYDAWGQPDSPNKLVNNDHGNYVFATFTGHIYDPVLDIYFAEARFYDAINRTWMAMDPIKDGLNWYQYAFSNPTTYWDPTGMFGLDFFSDLVGSGSAIGGFINSVNNKVDSFNKWMSDFAEDPGRTMGNWWEKNKTTVAKVAVGIGGIALTVGLTALTGGAGMLLIGAGVGAFTSGLNSYIDQTANGGKVDWGTLARDTLQGGVIGGISGGVGGAVAQGVSGAFGQFCGRSASNVVAQVAEKWAVGTVADGVTGTATTFVANMFDTEGDISESLQRTGDSMAMIWGNAAITSAVSVAAEAAVTPKCFVAGTAVVTSVGLVAIEHIKPGDMVLAENEETGEIAYKEVVRTFTNTTEELTHVTITTEDGQVETIDATPHHPFYVEGKGWVDACALHAGMVVWLADGTKAIVTDVVTEGLEHPVTVYNFEVTDFHTYFVGDSGILVHNTCGATGSDAPAASNKYAVSEERRVHILEGDPPGTGHGPNRGQVQGAFPDTWTDDQAIAAIERVANSPNSTWKQTTGPGFGDAPVTVGGPSPTAPSQTNNGHPVRFSVRGQDHGLNIEVIVEPGGEGIITGYNKGK